LRGDASAASGSKIPYRVSMNKGKIAETRRPGAAGPYTRMAGQTRPFDELL
jgi:hypothetical protein